jgi:hypothetical protein
MNTVQSTSAGAFGSHQAANHCVSLKAAGHVVSPMSSFLQDPRTFSERAKLFAADIRNMAYRRLSIIWNGSS